MCILLITLRFVAETDEVFSCDKDTPHPPPNFYEILVVPLLRQEKATVAYVSIVPIMFTCNQCYHKTRKEIASGAKGQ